MLFDVGHRHVPLRQDIQYVLSHAREGGDGLSRIEVSRIRAKDPVTGEEFDDVFVNLSYLFGSGERFTLTWRCTAPFPRQACVSAFPCGSAQFAGD